MIDELTFNEDPRRYLLEVSRHNCKKVTRKTLQLITSTWCNNSPLLNYCQVRYTFLRAWASVSGVDLAVYEFQVSHHSCLSHILVAIARHAKEAEQQDTDRIGCPCS